jgi:hypothetical protein
MRQLSPILAIIILLLLSLPALAARNEIGIKNESSDKQNQDQPTVSPSPTGSQVKNRNQIKTQNQKEQKQLRVNLQQQKDLQKGENEDQTKEQPKSVSLRSETAREYMSLVAQTVEKILTTQGAKGGIGQQISVVAKEQQQAQPKISKQLDKLESRRGLIKKLLGTDYQAVKELKNQSAQNQLRIKQLEQLQNQVTNQIDKTQLQETIQALVNQDTRLQAQIQAEEKAESVFGWLIKLFN